jgi:hypothetical protein
MNVKVKGMPSEAARELKFSPNSADYVSVFKMYRPAGALFKYSDYDYAYDYNGEQFVWRLTGHKPNNHGSRGELQPTVYDFDYQFKFGNPDDFDTDLVFHTSNSNPVFNYKKR